MSHLPERKEKICLNCGAQLTGRFCPDCGQENVEPKESIPHLTTHFFNDVTHFDGKFFSTVKLLLFKPGFLSLEYLNGRRAKYLNPIRMYLFISAVFFLVFFSYMGKTPDYDAMYKDPAVKHYIDSILEVNQHKATTGLYSTSIPGYRNNVLIINVPNEYRPGVHSYDSLQKSLPADVRDTWYERFIYRRVTATYQYFKLDPATFANRVTTQFFHTFPKIFFISLPIFAFFLYLLYINKRKRYYYVSHAIFSIHFYCATFIFLMIILLFTQLANEVNSWFAWGAVLFALWNLYYLLRSMHRFYQSHWVVTFVKFILQTALAICLIFTLMLFSLFNSFLNVPS